MPASSSPSDDVIELREYVAVLRRRKWLLVMVLIFFTALAGAYSFTRLPMHTARSEILVLPTTASSQYRPDQLVSIETEARLVKSAPVAEIAKASLRSSSSIADLLKKVRVETTADALVLDIFYTTADPAAAAAGADAFADAYLQYKRDRAVEAETNARRGLQKQIDDLVLERDKLEREIAQSVPEGAEWLSAQEERDAVNSQIAVLNGQVAVLPVTIDSGEVILRAEVPTSPSSPKHGLNLAMGLFVGAFLGIVAAFVRDRTDERISGRAELELALEAPVLAAIPSFAALGKRQAAGLVTEMQPRSPAAEAYRTLRTGVMAMGRQRDLRLFAVASPTLGDGKSTTTANLAVVLSHADKRILAISADLRRPTLHGYFGAENELGLSDVLSGDVPIEEAIHLIAPNLWLLSSGRPPARPAELLQSHEMLDLLVRQRELFDYVLIDCPPVLGLADTLAIAPFVDAILLVARSESTTRGAITHAVDQLGQVGAIVRGGVLNDVTPSRRGGMDGFSYSYGYGYGAREDAAAAEESTLRRSAKSEPAVKAWDDPESRDMRDASGRDIDSSNGSVAVPEEHSEAKVSKDP